MKPQRNAKRRRARRLGAENLESRQLLAGDIGILGHFNHLPDGFSPNFGEGRPDLSAMMARVQSAGGISADMIQQLRDRVPVEIAKLDQMPSHLSEAMARIQAQVGELQPVEIAAAATVEVIEPEAAEEAEGAEEGQNATGVS